MTNFEISLMPACYHRKSLLHMYSVHNNSKQQLQLTALSMTIIVKVQGFHSNKCFCTLKDLHWLHCPTINYM